MALAGYYIGLDEGARAEEQFNAAIAANPKYDAPYFRLALLALRREQAADAEKYLQTVLQLNPDAYEAHFHLGQLALRRGAEPDAAAQFQEALRLRPEYVEANIALGLLLSRRGDLDSALPLINKVISLRSDGAAYLERGRIRLQRRQFGDALADFRQAIALFEQQKADLAVRINDAPAQSRYAQADRARAQQEKQETEGLILRAEEYQAAAEKENRNSPATDVVPH